MLLLAIATLGTAVASSPIAISPEHRKFFEEKVRPVLVDHCYSCHSAESEKLKGGLMLDSRAAWEKGGDSGVAVVVHRLAVVLERVRVEEPLAVERHPGEDPVVDDALEDVEVLSVSVQ